MGVDRANFGFYFSVGLDVLNSSLDPVTKVVKLQLGDSSNQVTEVDGAELWGQPGIVSVPAAPTAGAPSCQTVVLKRGDRDIVLALRDVRASQLYGNLKPGDTAVFATSGPARCLFKANGSISLITTADGTLTGQTVGLTLGPSGFSLVTQFGGITCDANGIVLTVGQAALQLTPAGIAKLMGQQVSVLGSVAAIAGTVGTFLGSKATFLPTQAVVPFGAGPPTFGTPSTNVFVSL